MKISEIRHWGRSDVFIINIINYLIAFPSSPIVDFEQVNICYENYLTFYSFHISFHVSTGRRQFLTRTQPTFQRRINVVSTFWINVEITLIRRWKWNKIRSRIFNVAQRWYNVSARCWNNDETTLIQVST